MNSSLFNRVSVGPCGEYKDGVHNLYPLSSPVLRYFWCKPFIEYRKMWFSDIWVWIVEFWRSSPLDYTHKALKPVQNENWATHTHKTPYSGVFCSLSIRMFPWVTLHSSRKSSGLGNPRVLWGGLRIIRWHRCVWGVMLEVNLRNVGRTHRRLYKFPTAIIHSLILFFLPSPFLTVFSPFIFSLESSPKETTQIKHLPQDLLLKKAIWVNG